MRAFYLQNDDNVWSDEEFYRTQTLQQCHAEKNKSNSGQEKEDYDTTDSEDIPLADLRKNRMKRPVKRKIIQSDEVSDLSDSADD